MSSAWPPPWQQRRLPRRTNDFGAVSHGFGTRCLRLNRRDYSRRLQDSLPLLARLCGVGLPPTGPLSKGFRYASYMAFPFPKLNLTQCQGLGTFGKSTQLHDCQKDKIGEFAESATLSHPQGRERIC